MFADTISEHHELMNPGLLFLSWVVATPVRTYLKLYYASNGGLSVQERRQLQIAH